jgi:glycosyltransferase involved in cell wall biosynthesis
MSAARNLGMPNAAGTCIALLDADDLWLSQKLEKQVGILQAQPEPAWCTDRVTSGTAGPAIPNTHCTFEAASWVSSGHAGEPSTPGHAVLAERSGDAGDL